MFKLYREESFVRVFNNRAEMESFIRAVDPFYDHDWAFVAV